MLVVLVLVAVPAACDRGAVEVHRVAKRSATRDSLPAAGLGAGLEFRLPPGWRERPSGDMTVAAFEAGDRSRPAVVTITRLSGDGGGLLANVNRWRGQIGLPPIAEADLSRQTREVPMAGDPGVEVSMVGASEPRRSIRGVVASARGFTGFIKIIGPVETVEREAVRFREFAATVRFKEEATSGSR